MKWISVEDRLPDVGKEVVTLVYYAKSLNAHNDMIIANEEEVEWKRSANNCVKFWMPLPEPPKEEV